ncbi:hypothetical protein CH304_12850 [Rhodococcus sp. 15-649-1-2]|nr:hypothetical protein [Rhodococcus sp. 15-649-1-2]OZE81933.1 hypothetical protein CH304_12850 [Rhodococcus sp. 15-649-1-2]
MGSLSDSSNFGARPIDTQRFYGSEPVGQGRWVLLNALGLLWTDDAEALQLWVIPDADRAGANAVRRKLNRAAAAGVTATAAFDTVVAEHGNPPVTTGDLGELI